MKNLQSPKPLDYVYVKQFSDTEWIKKQFYSFKDNKIICLEYSNFFTIWDEYKMLPDEQTLHIMEKIKTNDPEVLEALAKLVLLTKENLLGEKYG